MSDLPPQFSKFRGNQEDLPTCLETTYAKLSYQAFLLNALPNGPLHSIQRWANQILGHTFLKMYSYLLLFNFTPQYQENKNVKRFICAALYFAFENDHQ